MTADAHSSRHDYIGREQSSQPNLNFASNLRIWMAQRSWAQITKSECLDLSHQTAPHRIVAAGRDVMEFLAILSACEILKICQCAQHFRTQPRSPWPIVINEAEETHMAVY